MDELVVDARWLEPPEPMERALQAIEALKPGQNLRLLIHRTPYLLYPILGEWGFAYRTDTAADGTLEILIWRSEPSICIDTEPS